MINIIVVDDHPIVRDGLKLILSDEKDIHICGEASNAKIMFDLLKSLEVDVVILDISMPEISGYEALLKLKISFPKIRILMLSALSEDIYASKSLKAGASGFINKETAPEELVKAVRKVFEGGTYISPYFAEKLAYNIKNDAQQLLHEQLSSREFQIMLLLGSGKSVGAIAESVMLSVKTISTYRTRILEKMNLKNNAEIIKYCIRESLF
jgi:DNA-binding NarL/FixJ family response regulator